jgi:hypothetical protein
VLDEHQAVTRFLDPDNGEPVIDVMRPVDLYQHSFDEAVRTELGHDVPSLEVAIASKFRALVSRNRKSNTSTRPISFRWSNGRATGSIAVAYNSSVRPSTRTAAASF